VSSSLGIGAQSLRKGTLLHAPSVQQARKAKVTLNAARLIIDPVLLLPTNIRQWFGDSRGHWEGETLVIDVTNFTPKTDAFGSRENLLLWR
jgi:hypothetical protein